MFSSNEIYGRNRKSIRLEKHSCEIFLQKQKNRKHILDVKVEQ